MLYFWLFVMSFWGCEEKQQDVIENVPTVPQEVDAADCIPEEDCCMICTTEASQACGDACISLDVNCATEPGCACDEVDVCSQ